jgi:hypothetical protein
MLLYSVPWKKCVHTYVILLNSHTTHTHIDVYTHTYMHICTHTYTHNTYTYIHIHMHTQVHVQISAVAEGPARSILKEGQTFDRKLIQKLQVVCGHKYVYIYTCVFIHVTHVCSYMCVYSHMCVRKYVYIFIENYLERGANIRQKADSKAAGCVWPQICVYLHMCVHTCVYIYICVCINMCILTCVCPHVYV